MMDILSSFVYLLSLLSCYVCGCLVGRLDDGHRLVVGISLYYYKNILFYYKYKISPLRYFFYAYIISSMRKIENICSIYRLYILICWGIYLYKNILSASVSTLWQIE